LGRPFVGLSAHPKSSVRRRMQKNRGIPP
jgi:hypothetical protein